MNRDGRGYIELISVSIIWGLTYTVLKYSLESLTPVNIAFFRFLIASLFFIPVVLIIKDHYSGKEYISLIILALSGILMYQLFFIFGEKGMSAGNASFIVSMEPIFITILSIATREDKFSWIYIIGLLISTAGLIVLLQPGSLTGYEIVSAIFILIAAFAWGIYTVVGRNLLANHNPLNVTAIVTFIGTVMLFPAAGLGSIHTLMDLKSDSLVAVLFMGIAATFLGYILWFDGLKYVKPTVAGATLYITPFITAITAVFIISEPIGYNTIIGGTMILAGVGISSYKRKG